MRTINGEYIGLNISYYIFDIIKEYKLADKLGWFIIDNAADNDIIIQYLSLALRDYFDLPYDPIFYRLRC
jgi:hypothetical protein